MWVRAIRAADVEVVATVTGRPTALNDIVAQRICKSLGDGNSRRTAAVVAGVTYATLCNWLKWGREGKQPYAGLFGRVEKVEHEAVEEAVARIRSGEPGWQGMAWWLERKFPKQWPRPPMPVAKEREEDLSGVDEAKLWEAVEALRKEKTG